MPDREKVINGLEREVARTDLEWLDCVEVKLLQDALALLKEHEKATIEPKYIDLNDETKAWLDEMDAVDALGNIADICIDWDGYRTANGLGGLINEIWAYARYCADRLSIEQEPIEARLNLCESCAKEYAECEADKTDLVYGGGVGNDNIIGCPWYMNRWKARESCEDAVSKQTAISALEGEYSDWNDDYNVPITHCIKAVQSLPSVQPMPLARVMTLKEVSKWHNVPESERDPIYVEYLPNSGLGISHWTIEYYGFNPNSYPNKDSGYYGKWLRCWTSRPTDAQRRATPWN